MRKFEKCYIVLEKFEANVVERQKEEIVHHNFHSTKPHAWIVTVPNLQIQKSVKNKVHWAEERMYKTMKWDWMEE